MDAWADFNVAIAGASAALAGLIIVALSVNVEKVLQSPSLTARGAVSIAMLVLALLSTGLGLIPDQPAWLLGLELAVPVLLVVIMEVRGIRLISTEPGVRSRAGKIAIGALPVLAFVTGTVLLIADVEGGFVGIAIGSLSAIASAVLYSWIALVEVLR
jgi:hypothetical protein